MSCVGVNFMLSLVKKKQPYSKSKLELESNLGEILPANCKFIRKAYSTST